MIWDESFETWNFYEVSSQPTTVLLDADGQELGRWRGLPVDEIAGLVESL